MTSEVNGIAATKFGSSKDSNEQDAASKIPNSTPLQESHAAYSTYQSDIYSLCMVGQKPSLTTISASWPIAAQASMSAEAWGYLEGGGGTSGTMQANRQAFNKWKLIPRMLTGNNKRTLKTTLFGTEYPSPVIMAPVGVNQIFHQDAESGVAKACAESRVPYTISTASSTSIEDIAAAGGANASRFFQLYWPRKQDDDVTLSLLKRAWDVGCRTLIVTLDTWMLGWRPSDLEHSYIPFFRGTGCQVGFSDPVFQQKYAAESGGKGIQDDIVSASMAWLRIAFAGVNRTWADLAFLRDNWSGALVVKGIQNATDAIHAIDAGCDGFVVSNHGGRQYDGASGSLSVLPEIVDAVAERKTRKGEKVTVLFDSGVRSGADIIKALALGADAVLVGRPVIYGLGAGGAKGASHVLKCLLADLDLNLALLGHSSVQELGRDDLRFEPWA